MYLFLSFMYIDSPILTRFGRVHLLSMKMSRTSVSGNIAVLSTLVMNTIMMADNSASSLQTVCIVASLGSVLQRKVLSSLVRLNLKISL